MRHANDVTTPVKPVSEKDLIVDVISSEFTVFTPAHRRAAATAAITRNTLTEHLRCVRRRQKGR